MENILVIESSPRQDISVSKNATEKLITQIKSKYPNANFVLRDLYKSPLPHVSYDTVQAFFTPPADRSEQLKKSIELSDSLTDELLNADTVVIGVPMWNCNIPSILKAWIDHVVRAGRTFSFSPDGLKGLASGKTVYIVTASGGVFSDGPYKAYDFSRTLPPCGFRIYRNNGC